MINSPRTRLNLYQLAAGSCDTLTGLALIFAPSLTLNAMGVHVDSSSLIWLSYIGVFVAAVGLSYLWTLLTPHSAAQLATQWRITALARSLVALFILVKLLQSQLPLPWLEVAATDACFATIQWLGLTKGWLAMDNLAKGNLDERV